jgi:hypothetical protein
MDIFSKKVKKAKKKNKLYKHFVKGGWNEKDAEEMVLAYFKHRTGGILRAVNTIGDYDDRDHDYTGELIFDILTWEYKQLGWELVALRIEQ